MAQAGPAVDAGTKADASRATRDDEKKTGRQGWKSMRAGLALKAAKPVGDRLAPHLGVAAQKTDKLADGLLDGVSKTWKRTGSAAVSTAALAAANRDRVIGGAGVAGMTTLKGLSAVVGAATGNFVLADERDEVVVHMEDGTTVTRRTAKKEKSRKKDSAGVLTNAQTLEKMGLRVPSTASEQEVQRINELIGSVNSYALDKGQQAGLLRYDVLKTHLGDPAGLEKTIMEKLEAHRSGSQRAVGDLVSKAELGLLAGTISTEDSGLVPTFAPVGTSSNSRSPSSQGGSAANVSSVSSALPTSGKSGRRQRTVSDPATAAFNRTGLSVPDNRAGHPRPIRKKDTMEFQPRNRVRGRRKTVGWALDEHDVSDRQGFQGPEVNSPNRLSLIQHTGTAARPETPAPVDHTMPLRTQSEEAKVFTAEMSDAHELLRRADSSQRQFEQSRDDMWRAVTELSGKRATLQLERRPHRSLRVLEERGNTLRSHFETTASELYASLTAAPQSRPASEASVANTQQSGRADTETEKLIKKRAANALETLKRRQQQRRRSQQPQQPQQQPQSAPVPEPEPEPELGQPQEPEPGQPQPVLGFGPGQGAVDLQAAWAVIEQVEARAKQLPQYRALMKAHALQGSARYGGMQVPSRDDSDAGT